ncbi:hypothetical protein Tsp_13227 [Trichinella spiralis]|uniref:Uncharacterized protein n=1 Tax=Trichinella spiralis TaxID=6334 RepID=E5T1V6_TRISP|nr:hypothetical protein Tsp_13227 [Trichinella spiralis]KRY37888.1 hypothetical protein T01_5965 [Trichinella spiralis]
MKAVSEKIAAMQLKVLLQILLATAQLVKNNLHEELETELKTDFAALSKQCFAWNEEFKNKNLCRLNKNTLDVLAMRRSSKSSIAISKSLQTEQMILNTFFQRDSKTQQCIRRKLFDSFPNFINQCYKSRLQNYQIMPEKLPDIDFITSNNTQAILKKYLPVVEDAFDKCAGVRLPVRENLLNVCKQNTPEMIRRDSMRSFVVAMSFFQTVIDRFDRFCQAECPHQPLLDYAMSAGLKPL